MSVCVCMHEETNFELTTTVNFDLNLKTVTCINCTLCVQWGGVWPIAIVATHSNWLSLGTSSCRYFESVSQHVQE